MTCLDKWGANNDSPITFLRIVAEASRNPGDALMVELNSS